MPIVTTSLLEVHARAVSKTDGSSTQLGTSLNIVFKDTIDKPLKASRPKPKDLFLNSTARTVKSTSVQYTYGSTDSAPWSATGGYLTVAPCSYWGPVSASFPAVDMARVDGALRGKIKDSNLNLAQSLAEYRQTSELFSSAVRDIAGIIRGIRSGRAGRELFEALKQPPGKMSKKVANRWLQFQYGVRPLMSDIYGSAEALAKVLDEGKQQFVSVKFTERHTSNTSSSIFKDSQITTTTLRGKARYTIKSAALKQLSEIGITNPALLVWEIIPYSFVIDWFVPIGNWLASLDALAGVGSLVVNRSYKQVVSLEHIGYGSGWKVPPSARCTESMSVRLAPTSNLSMPRLMYEPSLNLTKVLNAAALLRQLR